MQVSLYSPRINDLKRYADAARVERVMQATGCTAIASNAEVVAACDVLVLAVKPHMMAGLLAEIRPADDLARRVETIIEKFRAMMVLDRLMAFDLFGVTVAVPAAGVKATLSAKTLPVPATIEIVEELQDTLS